MKSYNFDEIINRKNTNSIKHDFAVERGMPHDVLPMWVADMDFKAPQPIITELQKAVEHGIFGYSDVKQPYYEAVSAWFLKYFNWQTESQWLVKTPGVVFALAMAVRALTQKGESVIIQPPVYYPFYSVIKNNDRKIVESELKYENGQYSIDFADFEQKIIDNNVKMFIMCTPHNPIGRVWTKQELEKIGEICLKHNVYVVADEIHCDFAFSETPHTTFLVANPNLSNLSIVCTAPSKTFNIAGLQVSNLWIPSEEIRNKINSEMNSCGYSQLNTLGLVATKAAYTEGHEWLSQCKAYLRQNLNFVRQFLQANIPQIKLVEPQGTYFAWLDCSELNLSAEKLNDLIINDAKLWLDSGDIFGKNSAQFQRVVLACPQEILKESLTRLQKSVDGLNL